MPKLSPSRIRSFRRQVYACYRRNKRRLPWRTKVTPYGVLVSEIMLQQTQVRRVIGKYMAFIRKFSSFHSLAKAPTTDVLAAWSGLGYNRRALHLHRAARLVVDYYGGKLPRDTAELEKLPGVGQATACAIAGYAFNQPQVYAETNIRTVFIHHFFKKHKAVHDKALLPLVAQTLDRKGPRRWYSALMDYGTWLKQQHGNAARRSAHYTRQSPFAGSRRQVRGKVLKLLLGHRQGMTGPALARLAGEGMERINAVLHDLAGEGFIRRHNRKWRTAYGK